MFPNAATQVNEYLPTSASNPLFYPVKVNLGPPDLNLSAAAATGTAMPQSLGAPYDQVVILIGHDNQLATVGGLLKADWQLPTFALDDTPPGGGFVFELRQKLGGSLIVRVYYISHTSRRRWIKCTTRQR
ncbi:MAG TPA: hypothetical protein VGL97_05700 [Bryobacteraceae bacterium]|jgi:4-phytase/acid phosphatase